MGSNAFDTMATVSAATGIVFMTCAWTAIYVAVHWYRGYRQSQIREMEVELSLRQAELQALQAQVNPHFLFNSLNVIRGTVHENPAKADDMITSLGNLFRRALSSGGAHMIPLREEMAAVSDYLALESARFEERLNVRMQFDPDAETCSVPVLLVQTLVENAVQHGIAHLPAGGTVSIRGIRENGNLVLEVENTGKLRKQDGSGAHTGLTNARQRLRLLCGDKASLDLADRDGTVAARVVIPQTL